MCFKELSGCELVTFANIFAVWISSGLSLEEIAALGSFFTIVGDSLSAIATADAIKHS